MVVTSYADFIWSPWLIMHQLRGAKPQNIGARAIGRDMAEQAHAGTSSADEEAYANEHELMTQNLCLQQIHIYP